MDLDSYLDINQEQKQEPALNIDHSLSKTKINSTNTTTQLFSP